MPKPGWLNDNLHRDYPFVTRWDPIESAYPATSGHNPAILPHSAIVDFGAIMDIDMGFSDKSGHQVYLQSVERSDPDLVFRFGTDAPQGTYERLEFTFAMTDPLFTTKRVNSVEFNNPPFDPLSCADGSNWSGFMTIGDLSDLIALLPDDGDSIDFIESQYQVEPSRIQNLARSYVRGLSLANFPRVYAEAPDGCSESGSSNDLGTASLYTACMEGNLVFREGYNCGIRQDRRQNALIISAGVGLGAGEPCEEVPTYPSESRQPNSPYFSGGPACSDIIQSVNGVSARNLRLTGGPGFRVYQEQANQLVVDRLLDDFTTCPPGYYDEPVISSSISVSVSDPTPQPSASASASSSSSLLSPSSSSSTPVASSSEVVASSSSSLSSSSAVSGGPGIPQPEEGSAVLYVMGSESSLSEGDLFDFGMFMSSSSAYIELYNAGDASLSLSSLTLES